MARPWSPSAPHGPLFFSILSSSSLRSDWGAKKRNLSFALITMVALHGVLYMTKIEPLRFCWNLSSHQAQLRFQHPTIPVSRRSLESFSCLRHTSDSIDLPRHAVGLISKAPLRPSLEANPRNPKLKKSSEKFEHKINWKMILENCAGTPKCYTTFLPWR